jgi:hypothetical protein
MKNEEINNEDLMNALESDTTFAYEEEDSFYEIEMNTSLKEAVNNALDKWGAEDEESKDPEKENKVLKTAVEIAMEKTNDLVEKVSEDKGNLKTAVEIAMEKTNDLPEEKEILDSKGDPIEEIESPVEETEEVEENLEDKKEEIEESPEEDIEKSKEEEVEEFKNSFEFPEVDNEIEAKSGIVVRTWERWKSKLSKKSNFEKVKKQRANIEELREQYKEHRDNIIKLKRESDELIASFEEKKSKVTDETVSELLQKDLEEKVKEKEKEALEESAKMDELREQNWESQTEIKEAVGKIREIESNYSDLIDTKINQIRNESEYDYLLEDVDYYQEKITKFKTRLDMVNGVLGDLDIILNDKDNYSKETVKEANKRYKKLSKKAIVITGAIKRFSKELDDVNDSIYKIVTKINKLRELKV